jgi:hypothetical protein
MHRVPACLFTALVVLGLAGTAVAQAVPPQSPDPSAGGSPLDVDPYATPYLYQNAGRGLGMSFTVQYEAGYGSRESRNFAQEGIEQGLRLRFQPWEFLGIEAFGGLVVDPARSGVDAYAGSVEIIGRPLNQRKHYVNLDLGAGYIYDYRGDHIPRVRLALSRSFGKLDLSLAGLLEIPVGNAGRDEVDVMTSLAVSYGVLRWLRLGIELAGEDLEGFEEEEEAEGGAKILFGPTFAFTLPKGFFIKLNTSAIYAHLANQKFAPGTPRPDTWGFMGRAAVGWTWN